MNASLKKGARAFEKTFGRVGEASDALGTRVNGLVEGTKVLKSVSEALNGVMGSLKESVEQQSSALRATLEPLKQTTREISTELESLKGRVSPLADSIGEVTKQIATAKEEFSLVQLKTSVTDARDAAESLGKNLRSVADAVSPASVDADFSVLKKFADAVTDLTAKVDDCARNLASLAEQPDQGRQPQRQFANVSNDSPAAHDPRSPGNRDSSSGARANGYPPEAMPEEGQVVGSSTSGAVGPNTYSSPQDNRGAENRDSALETRSRAWWHWRRG